MHAQVQHSRGRALLPKLITLLASGAAAVTFLLFLATVGDRHANAAFYLGQFFIFSAYLWAHATQVFTSKKPARRAAPAVALMLLAGTCILYAWIQVRAG